MANSDNMLPPQEPIEPIADKAEPDGSDEIGGHLFYGERVRDRLFVTRAAPGSEFFAGIFLVRA